ncbi:MAG: hypothetical protein WBG34_01630 [Flavobacteriales bacterium]
MILPEWAIELLVDIETADMQLAEEMFDPVAFIQFMAQVFQRMILVSTNNLFPSITHTVLDLQRIALKLKLPGKAFHINAFGLTLALLSL